MRASKANREEGVPLKEQAVLFRTSHHSAILEIELSRQNISFVKFGALKFLEAAHVKDMLAVLRWAENPVDRVTAFRVLQLLPGVGPGIAGRLLDGLAGRSALQQLSLFRPPVRAAEDWPAFTTLMLRERPGMEGGLHPECGRRLHSLRPSRDSGEKAFDRVQD